MIRKLTRAHELQWGVIPYHALLKLAGQNRRPKRPPKHPPRPAPFDTSTMHMELLAACMLGFQGGQLDPIGSRTCKQRAISYVDIMQCPMDHDMCGPRASAIFS